MWLRFFAYGVFGWCAEIVWTACYDAVTGTRRASISDVSRVPITPRERAVLLGRTYLWMLPLYGAGVLFGFEPLHDAVRSLAWPLRGGLYAGAFFAAEAGVGLLFKRLLGRCPWDYSYARTNLLGVIRLDYAPVWFAVGLLMERVHDLLRALDAPLRAALAG